MTSPRAIAEAAWFAAIRACNPRDVTAAAVGELGLTGRPLLIAVGKAAAAMADGALAALPGGVAGGIVVSQTGSPPAVGGLLHVAGDHPVPGEGSRRAADAIAGLIAAHGGVSDAVVLVSGGTSSLIAAPVDPLDDDDLRSSFAHLLASGASIDEMNRVRRHLLRWADGRLAHALAPARVHCLVVSDVVSGDVAAVGSGPCLQEESAPPIPPRLAARLPARVREHLARVTPQPTPPATARVVASCDDAMWAAMHELYELGAPPVVPRTLLGEARECAREVGRSLGSIVSGSFVAAGETTVTLPAGAPPGGRCQELALALAREIAGTDWTVLVAGTDGRDGPTDAAGAMVDGTTWHTLEMLGRDPHDDLAAHRAHEALDAAGALFRTGPTGTNVCDLLVAISPRASSLPRTQ